MPEKFITKEHLVFGLDIGTRSIVGSVGYIDKNRFNVVANYSKEHETRAMMDGQIHDILKVSDTISKVKNELEIQIGRPLKDVCIAAAGRVLKTVTVHIDFELSNEEQITGEHVYSLDLMGVEKAYDIIRSQEKEVKFYCVGYTVIKYYLNDYVITNLEGHKAKKISADVLATFLPEDVVDGLYTAVGKAGLDVANLTLEPIAAINIAIPQKFRLLNIALVDVGAGTSDISITKDGSIIAYGMIPHAGDELTETIVSKYLVEFNVAEKIKRASIMKRQISFNDIMGIKQKVSPEEVKQAYKDTVDFMTKEIADKIIELNGGKTVSAVFVVGGGGKVAGFTEMLSEHLDIPQERVALRGSEVLGNVDFLMPGVKKDPLLVTPIGICLSFYEQKNNFIFVNVNDERIKLYDNNKLTVVDAAMQIGFPNEALFPRRGKELEFTVNKEKRMQRGSIGEPAIITVNGEETGINSPIKKNDKILIKESTVGEPAHLIIDKLPEYKSVINVKVNGMNVTCPRFASVNGSLKSKDYEIQYGDEIEILDYYTVGQLLQLLDMDYDNTDIRVNNEPALSEDKIYDNFTFDFVVSDNTEDVESDDNYLESEDSSDRNNEEVVNDDLKKISNEFKNEQTEVSTKESSKPENTPFESLETKSEVSDLMITVNGTNTYLKNKKSYIFVDILDFYEFDTHTAGGKELITTINGERCDFTSPLNYGDVIEIYWR